jgi:release factor glutamine methyltransferase
METLNANVRDHEPRLALTDEADGYTFYRALAERSPEVLAAGGSLFVEVGETQAAAVRGLFAESDAWAHAGTWRDTTGPHDRVLRFDRRAV